jgi:hypothetical protein
VRGRDSLAFNSLAESGSADRPLPLKPSAPHPAAHSRRGELTGSPLPIPTVDGDLYLAAEILWPEIWPASHNSELRRCGTALSAGNAWRNDATGHSHDE